MRRGGGAAAFLLNKSDDGKSHSLDGMYMNIGTNDVVAIYNESTATSSSVNTSSSNAVSRSVGDLSTDVVGSLYKKNANGEFEPVKFFKNKESVTKGDNEDVKWLSDYTLVLMEKCGGFLHLFYQDAESTMNDAYELFVDTDSGKIYQVFYGFNDHVSRVSYYSGRTSHASPLYTYCGIYDGKPLFHKDNEDKSEGAFDSLCTFSIKEGNLAITELFNRELFKNVYDNVRIYKNGIIEFETSDPGAKYYRFSNGTFVKSTDKGFIGVDECDGYLCKDITRDSNGFVESYKKYTTDADTTELVTISDVQEKVRIETETVLPKHFCKYAEGNNTVILCLTGPSKVNKITLMPNATKTEETMELKRLVDVGGFDDHGAPYPDSLRFTVHDNLLFAGQNPLYWGSTNVSFNGNYMFFVNENRIVSYNMTMACSESAAWNDEVANLLKIDDVYYKDGHIIVKGATTDGKQYYAALDSNGQATAMTSDIILKETVILPLS